MPAQQKTEVSMISTTSTRAPVNFTRTQFVLGLLLLSISFFAVGTAQAQDKPNILIIWGDDVGWMNTSAYNRWLDEHQRLQPRHDGLQNAQHR
jgi:hypothetical protein